MSTEMAWLFGIVALAVILGMVAIFVFAIHHDRDVKAKVKIRDHEAEFGAVKPFVQSRRTKRPQTKTPPQSNAAGS